MYITWSGSKTYLQQSRIDIYEYISQRCTSNSSFCTQQPSGNLSIHFDQNKKITIFLSFLFFQSRLVFVKYFRYWFYLKRAWRNLVLFCSYRLAQEFKWVLIFALFTLLVFTIPPGLHRILWFRAGNHCLRVYATRVSRSCQHPIGGKTPSCVGVWSNQDPGRVSQP